MGYRKTKDVLAMANLLLNTRPDASSAEVMRKAASMLRDIAEERAHLTQPAQAVDVGAIREVVFWLTSNSHWIPGAYEQGRKLTAALALANGKDTPDAAR